MATKNRRKNIVIEKLISQPENFNFFQAVRLLQYHVNSFQKKPVGYHYLPYQESLKFKTTHSFAFLPSAIKKIKVDKKENFFVLHASFLGLTGASGVLPEHYTETLLKRLHFKDSSLQDFFDIFNHRIISFYYRAWEKHHFYVSPSVNEKSSSFLPKVLSSLIGLGLSPLKNRLSISDEVLFYYSGLLMQHQRSRIGLQTMLSDYFSLPVLVQSFQGEWVNLPKDSYSYLSCFDTYNCLGQNVVLGRRIWSLQKRIRIQIGPLNYQIFYSLLPISHMLKPLCELVRHYLGVELDFDVQLLLKSDEVPRCQLQYQKSCHLGWTTWLYRENRNKNGAIVLNV